MNAVHGAGIPHLSAEQSLPVDEADVPVSPFPRIAEGRPDDLPPPVAFRVIPIVAFSRQASLGISAGTPVIYWNQIWSVISQFKVKRIPPDALPGICNKLIESNIPDSKENRREHIHNVRSYERKRNLAVASGKCPRCGGELVLRHSKYGSFFGCSNYPRCKFTTH